MDCPRCSVPLRKVDLAESGGEYASVVLDQCPECHGLWLDKGELDQRDESVWTNAEALDYVEVEGDHEGDLCPKCSLPLTAIAPSEHPELVLDRCPECLGFWLDSGELETVQALAADLDSAVIDKMTPVQRPPETSWLSWALHCVVQQWGKTAEEVIKAREERYKSGGVD